MEKKGNERRKKGRNETEKGKEEGKDDRMAPKWGEENERIRKEKMKDRGDRLKNKVAAATGTKGTE